MGICGFNKKIGDGLQLLIEGMIEALEKKAKTSSCQTVLARELIELDNIISVLRTAPAEVLPEMFIGLDLLAKSLFAQVQNDLRASGSDDLASACREVGNNFIDLLAQTELKNEELVSNNHGDSIAETARKLAQWALGHSQLYKREPAASANDAKR